MKENTDGRDKPGHDESAVFTVSGLFVVRISDTTTAEPAGNDPDPHSWRPSITSAASPGRGKSPHPKDVRPSVAGNLSVFPTQYPIY